MQVTVTQLEVAHTGWIDPLFIRIVLLQGIISSNKGQGQPLRNVGCALEQVAVSFEITKYLLRVSLIGSMSPLTGTKSVYETRRTV